MLCGIHDSLFHFFFQVQVPRGRNGGRIRGYLVSSILSTSSLFLMCEEWKQGLVMPWWAGCLALLLKPRV